MGQKTEYNPDEWDFQEEEPSEQGSSDTSISVSVEDDFSASERDAEPLAFNDESLDFDDDLLELFDEPSVYVEEPSAVVNKPSAVVNKPSDAMQERKIYISHRNSGAPISKQEEEAFKKQIEDLFELLELEKEADKSKGIRVYQTDSSPSRPWRFH